MMNSTSILLQLTSSWAPWARWILGFADEYSNAAVESTVIVGAGVIGLSTAYYLALEASQRGQKASITVIDALPTVFGAASRHNSGCLIPSELSDELQELAFYSYDLYRDLAQTDETFASITGFRAQSNLQVARGAGRNLDRLPRWCKSRRQWGILYEPLDGNSAILNPVRLGKWLEDRCHQLGVKIHTGTSIIDVQMTDQTVNSISCITLAGEDIVYPSDVLVFAAGPWTPTILNSSISHLHIDLGFRPLAGDFLILKQPIEPEDYRSLSTVIMDDIVGHKLEFVGRNDQTIWTTAQVNPDAKLHDPDYVEQPDPKRVEELVEYANRFTRVDTNAVVGSGRSFRPITESGLPILSPIPSKYFQGDVQNQSTTSTHRSGVYICSGHGAHGIALGLGTGKVMAQLLLDQTTDVDVSKFSLK